MSSQFFSQNLYSQVKNTDELYKTAQKLDSLIFKEGYNQCNLSHYDSIISNDLEFYHDKGDELLMERKLL
ncbi:hypothetical protein [Chryseobacterium sp.]|uniref:hypothetical protein n=1 Tax=Chryseobacterium sp. TaxID=1871047 RepID=UPI0025C09C47|nr:hypothetical protein [Chryseobacterium sp.]